MTRVAQAQVEGCRPTSMVGLLGELDLISVCMGKLDIEASPEELMLVSGAGFRTHFFRPKDNPGTIERPDPERHNMIWAPRYAWSSMRYCNYGHHEAVAYFYGLELKEYQLARALKVWQLIRFELDEGRPLICYGLVQSETPELIVGYTLDKGPIKQSITVLTSASETPVEIDITGREILQGKGARYPNEVILVRPDTVAPWRPTDEVRLADMFRWAEGHLRSHRELVYESSRFYATGPWAFEALAEFFLERVPEELEDPLVMPAADSARDMGKLAQATVSQWQSAARGVAVACQKVADKLETPTLAEFAGGSAELSGIAVASAAVADALKEVEVLIQGDPVLMIANETVRKEAARQLLEARKLSEALHGTLRALIG